MNQKGFTQHHFLYPTTFKKSGAGFSLIEVIISMFMLTVMVVLYVAALNTTVITRKLEYQNLAYHIANKKMEELRSTSYAFLSGSGAVSDSLLAQIPSGSGTWSVVDYPGYSGLKQITVTVNWNDGTAKQNVLTTLAGAGGINP